MSRWTHFLSPAPDRRITTGNRLEHFGRDNRTIRAIWDAIEQAESSVWMTMYIFEPDEVGRQTIERLARAARRGCHVLLLYDQIGSLRLRGKHLAPLNEENAEIGCFHRFWPPWKKNGAFAIRNHRKLLIVDGEVAFCGGMNLAEEFVGDHFGEWVFDDTMVRVEGPCVHDLADVFMRTWREVNDRAHPLPPPSKPLDDGVPVEVLETDPRRSDTQLREMLSAVISRARHRCYLSSPYFIPPSWLTRSLVEAAGRGADVRVLTASKTDMRIARAAGRHCYGELLRQGVRIYERKRRILHSKTLTIDEAFGMVGSYNMDLWTSKHVLDVAVAAVDEDLAERLEKEFSDNLEDAREITLDDWEHRGPVQRLRQHLALQICKIL